MRVEINVMAEGSAEQIARDVGVALGNCLNRGKREPADAAAPIATRPEAPTGLCFQAVRLTDESIQLADLKDAIMQGHGLAVIRPFDLLTFPLDNGQRIAVQCAHVGDHTARFVFRDCYDKHQMNPEADNTTGYLGSEGRRHVLEDIYPHLPAELRDMIVPRQMVEIIKGERKEYADPLWLPSATDYFGSPDGKWWPDEPDSFQLPIFQRERNRVKEVGDEGTCWHWLRSVYSSYSAGFCYVRTGGSAGDRSACYSLGFAPGFDL